MKRMKSLMIIIAVISVAPFLIDQISSGQPINSTDREDAVNDIQSAVNNAQNDTTLPSVNITNPLYPPTVTTGKIVIEGTANDSGSGIQNVSADVHTFPFDGHFPVPLASKVIPISSTNWSQWSVPLIINKTDSYRVVITARDYAGNVNYAETTINAAIKSNYNESVKMMTPKIAFVRPTFTEAAYQENGFYRFYFKYGFPPLGKKITTDLDMLTVKTPRSVSEFQGNDIGYLSNITSLVPINGTELHDVSQNYFPHPQKFWLPFIDHIKKVAPNSVLTVMRDEDVHDGHIFYPHNDNKKNAYDILLLFHNEYVTQQEYDNFKQFVKNGGTIVFIDANVFYAEVRYDRNNHTVTLVKGHDWQFDGKAASRSVPERWYDETKEWVGSNFLINNIKEEITFANNLFNYTHFEEQFVNNPKAKIIVDYGIKFPKDFIELYLQKEKLPAELKREDISIDNIRVASYSMEYGKGKVIMLGLSGRLLSENQEFLKFFDNDILPKALCPKFQSCTFFPTTHYLYGCTDYKYVGYHCDPILNEFESYTVLANYTKITSATREPSFVESKSGKGLRTTGAHALESLRANIIDAYDANRFTVYLSFMPDKYEEVIGNPFASLISYKNGVFKRDPNNVGWEMELVPNNNTHMKKLRFTVFDTSGVSTSPNDVDIPVGKFSKIAGTFDGSTVRIFVNGTLRSEAQFAGNYSGNVNRNNFLKIAGDAYCSCYLASGIFDEARYYNYSLTSEQIKQIDSHNDVLGKGLVGHWDFDGDLKDSSGFNNDLFYNTLISSMAFAPDGRMFFTEKNSGNIRVMINDTVSESPFASIPNIHVNWEQGLLGLTVDSKFIENHYVYVYYNYEDQNSGNIYARIIRFTDVDNKGTNEKIILDRIPASTSGFHTGGALAFNKVDEKLYATIGDAIDATSAQNISSLNGKTLRINREGTIPDDNPFPNSPVYTYGHRNMFGIAFDDKGNGLVTEPGSALYDEINSQIKGGNYGWRTLQPANLAPDPLAADPSIKPLRSYYVTENPTQAAYYSGDKFPHLKDKFIVGSFRGDLYVYKLSGDGKMLLEEIKINTSDYPSDEIVATAVSPDGDIYFGAYDLYRLNEIDFGSKREMMFPIQVNATEIKVSNVNYSDKTNDIEVMLSGGNSLSTFSIRIPKSITEHISEGYECRSNNASSMSESYNSQLPYRLDVQRDKKYDVITIHPEGDITENLLFSMNSSGDSSSKMNICLLKGNIAK